MTVVHHLALRQKYHDGLFGVICFTCRIYRTHVDNWVEGQPLRVDDFLRNVFKETSGYPFWHRAQQGVEDPTKPSLISLEAFVTFSTRLLETIDFDQDAVRIVEKELEELDLFVRDEFLAPELSWNSGVDALHALRDVVDALNFKPGYEGVFHDPMAFLECVEEEVAHSYSSNAYSTVRHYGGTTLRAMLQRTRLGPPLYIDWKRGLVEDRFGLLSMLAACDDGSVEEFAAASRKALIFARAVNLPPLSPDEDPVDGLRMRDVTAFVDYLSNLNKMNNAAGGWDDVPLTPHKAGAVLRRVNFDMREYTRWRRLIRANGFRDGDEFIRHKADMMRYYNKFGHYKWLTDDSRALFGNAIELVDTRVVATSADVRATLQTGLALAHLAEGDPGRAADELVAAHQGMLSCRTHLAWADWYVAVADYMKARGHDIGRWLALDHAITLHKASKNMKTPQHLRTEIMKLRNKPDGQFIASSVKSEQALLDLLEEEPPSLVQSPKRRGKTDRETR